MNQMLNIPYTYGICEKKWTCFLNCLLSSLPEVHVLFLKTCHGPSLLTFKFHYECLNSIGSLLLFFYLWIYGKIYITNMYSKDFELYTRSWWTNHNWIIMVNLHWYIYIYLYNQPFFQPNNSCITWKTTLGPGPFRTLGPRSRPPTTARSNPSSLQ